MKTTVILTIFYLLPGGEIEHREHPQQLDSVKYCVTLGNALSSRDDNSIGFNCDSFFMKKKVTS